MRYLAIPLTVGFAMAPAVAAVFMHADSGTVQLAVFFCACLAAFGALVAAAAAGVKVS